MSFHPNARQALAIFGLLFGRTPEEREPMKSKLKPELSAEERRQLVRAGLLELDRRGRAEHLRATDAAWEWAGAHLDIKLPKSQGAAAVLENLLSTLKSFLPRADLALADLFITESESGSGIQKDPAAVRNRIREAIVDIAGGATRKRVRLSDLRSRLDDLPRDRLDRELLEMQAGQRLVLYKLDNPAELTAADRQAALQVAGNPRHLVYLEA